MDKEEHKIPALFIDDSDTENFLVEAIIDEEELPIEATFVTSGEEALQYFNQLSAEDYPMFVMVDINMPMMNGFDFMKEYDKMFDGPLEKRPYFYILTSSIRSMDKVKFEEIKRLRKYFEKPFGKDVFDSIKPDLT